MSDLELLFLVLILLYLWECACWLRRGAVGFRTWFGSRWKVIHPGAVLGNQLGGFTSAPPLPPLGTIFIGNQLPVSMAAPGVLAFVASSVNPGWRSPQTGDFYAFDQIRDLHASGKRIFVNGRVLLRTASPRLAAQLTQQLRELHKVPRPERESAILKLVKSSFETEVIAARIAKFREATRGLRNLANFLFLYLFVLAPMLIWALSFKTCWRGLAIGLLACTLGTALLFRRAHTKLFPTEEDERFTHFLIILLSPVTAIRARDLLARPLLERFHPLAIASTLCSPGQLRDLGILVLREIRHPGLPVCPRTEPEAIATELLSRALLQEQVEQLLARKGLKPEELMQPPTPLEESCRSYCPRCRAQFTVAAGICEDCGGLELIAFDQNRAGNQ